MNMNKDTLLDFGKFYLIEFFNNSLEKGENSLSEGNFKLLKELAGYLTREENSIEGFEKLAQYQGTNEFSIFLFDMIDHLYDYVPEESYKRLPELANDFVKLYNLMLEEPESVNAIEDVLKIYRSKMPETVAPAPEKKEAQIKETKPAEVESPADKPEEKFPDGDSDAIHFFEFYEHEFADHLLERIEKDRDAETAALYRELLLAFRRFNRNVEAADRNNYRNSIVKLSALVEKLFPEHQKKIPALRLMRNIDKQVKKFISQAKRFERYNKKAFLAIVKDNEFTKKQARTAAKKKETEEVSSIESILGDYFNSEVNHRIDEIDDQIGEIQDKQEIRIKDIDLLISRFKSLKEVSMIHGYAGMEHLTGLIIKLLNELNREDIDFSEESFDILRDITSEMRQIKKFENVSKDDQILTDLEQKIFSIRDTVSEVTAEEEEAEEEEIETTADENADISAPEKPEETIAGSDTQTLLPIAKTVAESVSKHISSLCDNTGEPVVQKRVLALLNTLGTQTGLVDPELKSAVFNPLTDLYESVFKAIREGSRPDFALIDSAWEKSIEAIINPDARNDLAGVFESAAQAVLPVETDDSFAVNEDERLSGVLAEAIQIRWNANRELLKAVFLKGEKQKEDSLIHFFNSFHKNLEITGYIHFQPFPELIIKLIGEHGDIAFDEEIIFELENSVNLVLERIRHKGKNGDCADITSTLDDLLTDLKQARHKTDEESDDTDVEAKAEESEKSVLEVPEPVAGDDDEDVTAIFYSEVKEHLDTINDCLEALDASPNDRKQYTLIETAVHDIRASAHLLNLSKVVKLSALLEEIAEIYGQSEIRIPDDLATNIRSGVEDLKIIISDPEADIEQTLDKLQYLIDHIVIEDSEPEPEPAEKTGESEKAPSRPVEEKPLFLETEDVDQEFLDVFRQEATSYLEVIEKANRKLIQDLNDKSSLDEFENAAHSLQSAAKMIGFKEIGQLTEGLENIAETIKGGEVDNSIEIQDKIASAIDVIKRLSHGDTVSSNELVSIMNTLDSRYFTKTFSGPEPEQVETDLQADTEMMDVFLQEGNELIEALNQDLLELEQAPESETVLNDILRRLHTMKGSAGLFNFDRIKELAHKLEDYFQIYKKKTVDQKQDMLNTAFAAIDLIAELLEAIKARKGEEIDQFTARMAEIDNRIFLYQNFDTTIPAEKSETDAPKSAPSRKKRVADDDNIIRIQTEYLDRLVDMTGDLMINQSQLSSNLDNLQRITTTMESEKKRIQGMANSMEEFLEQRSVRAEEQGERVEDLTGLEALSESMRSFLNAFRGVSSELNRLNQDIDFSSGRISNISKLLHNDMLKTRMITVDKLFNRYPRPVRDLAREQGKRINLVIEGGDTEMDRAMIDALNDPVMHIIRNAVDHGIEPASERTAKKKDKAGNIILRARHDKNQVVIEIADDGRGIELDRIRNRIIENELASVADVEQMSEAEILDYIFKPGFTTRDEATDVSGRGIGLDVVNMQIQKLKGNIRIRTEPEQGTVFSIRVPLTLLISQALMVRIQEQPVAIPLSAIQETVYFSSDELEEDDGKQFLSVRGNFLPFINLSALLQFEHAGEEESAEKMAVIVHDAGVSVALGVDQILDRQEIVIKSLGSHLQNIEYIAGGTILGSGEVGLILDYAAIIRSAEVQFFGSVRDKFSTRKVSGPVRPAGKRPKSGKSTTKLTRKSISKKKIKDRRAKILIVDDSISVRNFVGSILERNNYSIHKSSNGFDAWETLSKGGIDLMITDLEMPEMHGFELIEKIRGHKNYDDLPIIILTGRAGMKHKQKGEKLGANSFLVKPFKEIDLLQSISDFIVVEK